MSVIFFNSFSTSTCFVLFEVNFLFKFFSFSSKSAYFTKLVKSFLLAKFACAYPAATFSVVNLLNSVVLIYLLWSDILFSTVVRAVVVAMLVILGISFFNPIYFSINSSICS